MAVAARQAVSAFRKDPLQLVLAFTGVDLTGKTLTLAIRLYPDAPGEPLMEIGFSGTPGSEGCRLVSVLPDADGIPISIIEVIAAKASIDALPVSGVVGAEAGADVRLHYDLQVDALDLGDGLSAMETTLLYGEFIVKGGAND